MRKEDEQAYGPDLHRPIDKQEIAEPNEGDPEARELGHLVGQTAEAQEGVFETGAPSALQGALPPERGLSSSPDPVEPATAEFHRADGDPMMTTTRENFAPPERHAAEELAAKRSDDDVRVVARPSKGPNDHEIAELIHSPQAMKEPKEPMDR
jgi:hypothetical protein